MILITPRMGERKKLPIKKNKKQLKHLRDIFKVLKIKRFAFPPLESNMIKLILLARPRIL